MPRSTRRWPPVRRYFGFIPGGGDYDPIVASLTAMEERSEPANDTTDLYVHSLASRQDASGAWTLYGVARPPMEQSIISRTANCVRVLKYYALPARKAEFDARIARWLKASHPTTSLEYAERLIALKETGDPKATNAHSLDALLQMQHPDGGWANGFPYEKDQWISSAATPYAVMALGPALSPMERAAL